MKAVESNRQGTEDKTELGWMTPSFWQIPVFLALAWLFGQMVSPELDPLAGLRFVVLWMLLPPRRWIWLVLLESAMWGAIAWMEADWRAASMSGLQTIAEWLAMALVVHVMPARRRPLDDMSIARMGRVLLVMMLCSLAAALAASLVAAMHGEDAMRNLPLRVFRGGLERYMGMLLAAPVLSALVERPMPWELWRSIGWRLLVWAPYLLGGYLLLNYAVPSMRQSTFLLPLPPLADLLFAFGWRGGVPLVSAMATLAWSMRKFGEPVSENDMAAVIVIGSGAFMLGAAAESLRKANRALREAVAREQRIGAALADRTISLRELGRRMIRAREDEQARIARELHDELGQLATALGTQLGLIEARAGDPALRGEVQSAQSVARQLRETIRQVASHLRPPVLDRFGLAVALREGPIANLLHTAGVDYDVDVSGPVELLDGDIATAIYRICQEAATNCVRHADASQFQVRLKVAKRHDGRLSVRLTASDDGQGIVDEAKVGSGLRGIADRVLALSGDHGFVSSPEGTRHEVTLVVDPAARDGAPPEGGMG